ncbi:MAG: DUF4347 domain-containing protein [Cyanobacteriota bacterium]|nr:DUF4347 domain-containing protein [Cyanobacteriota bacterium]
MNNSTKSILFIDSSIDNYDFLIKGVVEDIEKIILDSKRNGVEQITDVLAQEDEVETIHIVSHGSPGCLYLGNSELNLGNLKYYKQQLQNWYSKNLLIYGCNVAAGDAGEEFVEKLHRLTGANIAASKTKTGNAELGGDWELEVRVGSNFAVGNDIGLSLIFEQNTLTEYSGVFAPGDLESTFGYGNIDIAYDIAIQPDGKILVVGAIDDKGTEDFAILRYNPDETLDTSFGNNGKVITDISGASDTSYELAIQPDGKLVLVGTAKNGTDIDIAIARYNANGSLDNNFGNGGKVITDFDNKDDYVKTVAIQSDGKIVIGGYIYGDNTYDNKDFALIRYNVDGTLDTGFGKAGRVITPVTDSQDFIQSILIQPNGKILAVGSASYSGFGLTRYNTDGTLDTSFGIDGKVRTNLNNVNNRWNHANSAAIQPDGKIVVAGFKEDTYNTSDFALTRYNTDGSLDSNFGDNGKVVTAIGNSYASAESLVITPNGKIVVAGTVRNNDKRDFALVAYNPDGSLDRDFGDSGKVITVANHSIYESQDTSIALQADGKIVLAGRQNWNTSVVKRYEGVSDNLPSNKPLISDNFDSGTVNSNLWSNIQGANPSNLPTNSSGNSLYFNGSSGRSATTVQLDVTNISKISFKLATGDSSKTAWEAPESIDKILLQYSTDGGKTWVDINSYGLSGSQPWTEYDVSIPTPAQTSTTQFRWIQPNYFGEDFDNWAIDDIAIGESTTDTTKSGISDNFDSGTTNSNLWSNVEGANPDTLPPGSSGKSLYFNGSSRSATTVQLDVTNTNTISFQLAIGDRTKNGWDSPETQDKILLEYSTNGGQAWIEIDSYGLSGGQAWKEYNVTIPTVAKTSATQFRWIQPNHSGNNFDNWAIDDVVIGSVESEPNVNSAPSFTSNATLNATEEDTTNPQGETIANLFKGKFQDSNSGASLSGIAVVTNTADYKTEGRWEYSTDSLNWWNIGGSVNDNGSALPLSANTKIRFLPASDYNGTPPSLGVRALDNTYSGNFSKDWYRQEYIDTTNNGGTSAISASIAEIKTTINAVNDAPIVIAYQVISFPENYSNGSVLGTVAATDAEQDALSNWQISSGNIDLDGDGIAAVSINQNTGEIAISDIDDFNSQSNPNIQLKVNVGDGKITSKNEIVTVKLKVTPGDLDTSFGDGGTVVTKGMNYARSVVIQPDDKIIVLGGHSEFNLARYNLDGSLDNTFGNAGVIETSISSASETGEGITLQPDGKIVVAGYIWDHDKPDSEVPDFALARYNSNGSLDTSFGNAGSLVTDFGQDFGRNVLVQPDGKIILAGYVGNGSSDPVLIRYNADGEIDRSFGDAGKVDGTGGYAAALQSDGKIVVGGRIYIKTGNNTSNFYLALSRYNSDGSLDNSFGTDGRFLQQTENFEGNISSIGIQSDGKIIVAGYLWRHRKGTTSNKDDLTVVRFNSDGSLDTSFGDGGQVVTPLSTIDHNQATGLTIQPNGKIVVSGYIETRLDNSWNRQTVIVAYNPDGTLDNSFGTNGHVMASLQSEYDATNVIATQSDGNIVVIGRGSSFNVARYIGVSDDIPTSSNRAPVLAETPINLNSVNQNSDAPSGTVGTLISSLVDLNSNVTDANNNTVTGIAITSANTDNGSWWYSINNGTDWNSLADVSNANARLLAADTDTRIYFQPNTDFNGDIKNAIVFRAWDQTTGSNGGYADTTTSGGTTAFSNMTDIASIQVNPLSTVSIKATDPSAAETNNDKGNYYISRTQTSGDLTVQLAIDTTSNASTSDYLFSVGQNPVTVISSTVTVVIPDGIAGVNLALSPIDDDLTEDAEKLQLNLVEDKTYLINGKENTATVTIDANDLNESPIANNDTYWIAEDGTLITAFATTSLVMNSEQGNYVGQGKTYNFTSESGKFSASRTYPSNNNSNNGVQVSFNEPEFGGSRWSLSFAAPFNTPLELGKTYTNAIRFPFQSLNQPGLSVSGEGRGNNKLTGEFSVSQIIYGLNDKVTSFDATFEQLGQSDTGVLTGRIKYNATIDNSLPGVLTNDTDADSTSLKAILVSGPANGNLNFNTSGGFTYTPNSGFKGIDEFTYRTTDGRTTSDVATVTLKVGISDAPIINLSNSSLTYTENNPDILINSYARVSDADSPDFDGGQLLVSITGSTEDDRLKIRNQGTISTQINLDGNNINYGKYEIGTFIGGIGTEDLVITLNSNARVNHVEALLKNITYENVSKNPVTRPRKVEFVFTDGDGGTSETITKTIDITAINETPEIAMGQTFTISENSRIFTSVGKVTGTDADGDYLRDWKITDGNLDTDNDGRAAFSINYITGEIKVNDSDELDFETNPSFNLQVTASDRTDTSIPTTVTVNLNDITGQQIIGTSSNDKRLYGGLESDTIDGKERNDYLYGRGGNDTLIGGTGNDNLYGGEGDDSIDGGTGFDILRESADVNFTLTDTQLTGSGTDTFVNIERAILSGGNSDNIIDASAYSKNTYIYGRAGNDTLLGGTRNDYFYGEQGDDFIDGGRGYDIIRETRDVDFTLTNSQLTGNGTDTIASIERVILTGGNSDNTIDASGFSGSVYLKGSAGNDTLLGGQGRDSLYGGQGNDSINGGAGNDYLYGESGDDSINGGEGFDTIRETGNVDFTITDTQLTGNGTDAISSIERAILKAGNSANKVDASGFSGSVYVYARSGNDTLLGGAGNDYFKGDSGDDLINGGAGNDRVYGGSGKDTFVLSKASGKDTIYDFENGIDSLGLSDGLSFNDLDIQANGNNTNILFGNQVLATLNRVNSSLIEQSDFTSL